MRQLATHLACLRELEPRRAPLPLARSAALGLSLVVFVTVVTLAGVVLLESRALPRLGHR